MVWEALRGRLTDPPPFRVAPWQEALGGIFSPSWEREGFGIKTSRPTPGSRQVESLLMSPFSQQGPTGCGIWMPEAFLLPPPRPPTSSLCLPKFSPTFLSDSNSLAKPAFLKCLWAAATSSPLRSPEPLLPPPVPTQWLTTPRWTDPYQGAARWRGWESGARCRACLGPRKPSTQPLRPRP